MSKLLSYILMFTMGTLFIAFSFTPPTGKESKKENATMIEQLAAETGMDIDDAEAIVVGLQRAGFQDCSAFNLTRISRKSGYTLSFLSEGKKYAAQLNRQMILEYITDESGLTVFAVIK